MPMGEGNRYIMMSDVISAKERNLDPALYDWTFDPTKLLCITSFAVSYYRSSRPA